MGQSLYKIILRAKDLQDIRGKKKSHNIEIMLNISLDIINFIAKNVAPPCVMTQARASTYLSHTVEFSSDPFLEYRITLVL